MAKKCPGWSRGVWSRQNKNAVAGVSLVLAKKISLVGVNKFGYAKKNVLTGVSEFGHRKKRCTGWSKICLYK